MNELVQAIEGIFLLQSPDAIAHRQLLFHKFVILVKLINRVESETEALLSHFRNSNCSTHIMIAVLFVDIWVTTLLLQPKVSSSTKYYSQRGRHNSEPVQRAGATLHS